MIRSSLLSKSVAEFIGTFGIVFFGCGAIRLGLSPTIVSIIFGLTVAIAIYALGRICGAHFNPAVTLAFTTVKRFPKTKVWAYWFSQLSGAFLAIFLLSFLLPRTTGFGAVTTHVGPWQTFGWETALTFFLMSVIIWVSTDPRASKAMTSSAIGGFVAIGSLVGGPITGAAMNPARYLAPAFAEGNLEWWWIYLAGAFIGAMLAAFVYESIRSKN